MIAPTTSRSQSALTRPKSALTRAQSALTEDAPRRRPMLQRRNTYTRDASGLDPGTSQSGASAFGSIKAGVSKGFFATQQKKPEGGGGGGSSMDMAGAMSASDLNEKGEAVVAAADDGFTPFSGASVKRTKSFGGGAAAAVRANLRRQQSLKQGGRAVGTLSMPLLQLPEQPVLAVVAVMMVGHLRECLCVLFARACSCCPSQVFWMRSVARLCLAQPPSVDENMKILRMDQILTTNF